ncbi:MAG: TolC family protein [Methylocystis sp.]|nr:TolC family protein [Methylocystis sp.]
MRRRGFLAALAGAALLPACAAPRGPAAEPGAIALPKAFAGRGGALPPELAPGWWRLAGCPVLDRLVANAEVSNPGLAEATARLAEARALEGALGQAFRPQLGLAGNLGRETQSWDAERRERNQRSTIATARADISLELDFAGRAAAEARIAAADSAIAAADADAARRLLAVELFRARAALGQAGQNARVAERAVTLQRRLLALAEERVRLGLAPELDAARVETALRRAEARLPEATAEAARARATLVALTGRTGLDGVPLDAPPLDLQAFRFTDVPAEVLRRRPDVQAAEAALARAGAARDLAAADLLPRLTLAGNLALGAGLMAGGLTTGLAALGPSVTLPVFDRDIRLARVAASDAAIEAALARHAGRVTEGAAELRRGLAALAAARAEDTALARALDAARRAGERAEAAYRAGLADLSATLDASLAVSEINFARLATARVESEAVAAVLTTAAG